MSVLQISYQKLFLVVLFLISVLTPAFSQTIALPTNNSEPADKNQATKVVPQSESNSTGNESNLTASHQENQVSWEGTIFVNQPEDEYFYAQIMNRNGSISILAVSSGLQNASILISKPHPLKFVDCFNNYILLKQVENTSSAKTASSQDITIQKISAYYLYELKTGKVLSTSQNTSATPSTNASQLNSTAVAQLTKKSWLNANEQFINSLNDDSSFTFSPGYVLTGILQLDNEKKLLYVMMKNVLIQQTIIYKIDLANKVSTLITTAWFSSQGKNINGGNSKVLVDKLNSQFLIYPKDQILSFTNETQFLKLNYSQITTLPIFKDNIAIIYFQGSFFHFSSASSNHLQLNGFLYSGYGENHISGEVQLSTETFFYYFADNYNIFFAVGSSNMLWVEVFKNQTTQKYENYTLTLLESVKNQTNQKAIIEDFKRVSQFFYHDNQLYLLTPDQFLIYQNNNSKIEKVYQIKLALEIVAPQVSLISSEENKTEKEKVQVTKDNITSNDTKSPGDSTTKTSDNLTTKDTNIVEQSSKFEEIDQNSFLLLKEMKKYHDLLEKVTGK